MVNICVKKHSRYKQIPKLSVIEIVIQLIDKNIAHYCAFRNDQFVLINDIPGEHHTGRMQSR